MNELTVRIMVTKQMRVCGVGMVGDGWGWLGMVVTLHLNHLLEQVFQRLGFALL